MLDEAVEEKAGGEKVRIGMVVRVMHYRNRIENRTDGLQVIRGNSVVMLEVNNRTASVHRIMELGNG